MEISISHQLIQAASSLILGAAAGFLYDFFRVVRRRSHSKTITAITDFLFWLITGLALFLLGLSLGQGRQRVFMNIFAMLGAIIYFLTLSRFSLFLCNALADALIWLFFILSRPFVWIYLALKKISVFIKNIFHYVCKWFRIYADNTYKYDHHHSSRRRIKSAAKKSREGVDHEAEKGRYYYEARDIRSDRLRVRHADQSQSADRNRLHKAGSPPAAGHRDRKLGRRTQG
jgi:ABC-type multidrug transport system fused ATPase/permease subunit